eukprot:14406896-Alexandrium_andersonii.AAC.1
MADTRLLGMQASTPASPASTASEWVAPSTAGMGTTVSGPIFTPQASAQVPKASMPPAPVVSAPAGIPRWLHQASAWTQCHGEPRCPRRPWGISAGRRESWEPAGDGGE